MPRLKRVTKRRRSGWSESHINFLLTGGYGWFPTGEEFADEAEARRAWDQLRDELVERKARQRPGTRPWAWWQFGGAPDEVRVIAYEIRGRYNHTPYSHLLDLYKTPHPIYEPEVVYLHRHGLLLDGELEAFWRQTTRCDPVFELLPAAIRPPAPPSWYPEGYDRVASYKS